MPVPDPHPNVFDREWPLRVADVEVPLLRYAEIAGPAAEELMARWTAPYLNPATNQWSGMYGVWVGRKCC